MSNLLTENWNDLTKLPSGIVEWKHKEIGVLTGSVVYGIQNSKWVLPDDGLSAEIALEEFEGWRRINKQLPPKDLLTPRIKIIGGTPTSAQKVGDIIDARCSEDPRFIVKEMFDGQRYELILSPEEVTLYPHLYEILPWWAERQARELPQYLKLESSGIVHYVHKVERWIGSNIYDQPLYEYLNKVRALTSACVKDMLPATHEEYEDFCNISTTKNGKP